MLTKDGEMQQQHHDQEVVERTKQVTKNAVEERIRNESISTGMDAGMDMTDPEQRWGRKMDVQDVIKRLKRINPNLIFEISNNFPSLMGMYVPEWNRDFNTGGWSYEKKYVMAMENGMMPEFSITYAETLSLPDPSSKTPAMMKVKQFAGHKRGWRAILVTLLRKGLATEEQVMRGWNIDQGRESRVWRDETGHGQQIIVKEGV